jgi:hypothetical protein
MNISRITMCAAVYAALLSPSAAAQNLVPHGGFENGLSGWTVTGATATFPVVKGVGLHDDKVLALSLSAQQKVTIDASVPIPKGVSMVRASIWLDSPDLTGNGIRAKVNPLGLYLSNSSVIPPILESAFVDVSSWSGTSMPLRIEITGAPYDSMRIYLDDLVMEPVDPNGLRLRHSGLWSNNSLRPSNFTSPTSPLLLFLAASPMQQPWRMPGVQGAWWLDSATTLLLASGSAQGMSWIQLPAPFPPRSIRFAAQLIEFDVANNVLRLSNPVHSRTF